MSAVNSPDKAWRCTQIELGDPGGGQGLALPEEWKGGSGIWGQIGLFEMGKWRQSHSQFLQLTPNSSSGKEVEMWYWCL